MPDAQELADRWYVKHGPCCADRTYQHHHARCPQCRAAGANPAQDRCSEGQELWATYQQAGDPPHFTWANRGGRKS